MASKYQTPWVPMSKNEGFWKEVLVGRTIKDVVFHQTGIEYLLLDNGEKVFTMKDTDGGTLCIQDDE